MDTKWNSTDKHLPGEAAGRLSGEQGEPLVPAVRAASPGGRVKALAGFLAFVLGATLVLSSLGAVGNRIAWERDPSPRWADDWQETDAFRDEVSRYLREFLSIAAGGRVDFYREGYWEDHGGTYVVRQEAIRSWWGYGEAVAEALPGDPVTGYEDSFYSSGPVPPASSDSDPAEPEEAPDAAYREDKNVLYFIRTGKEGKVYSNADGDLDGLQARSVEGYNFYLQFLDGKVSVFKDGQSLDVYGNGLYTGESQWFVPGYDNFPVSEDLKGVKVVMAVRQTPVRYYQVNYKTSGVRYNSSFYNIARQVNESWTFYRTQLWVFIAGVWGLVVWFLLRKSAEAVNRKIAAWTVRVWTEVRFLAAALCALWAFLPGFVQSDSIYELLYYGWEWDSGYSFAAWGQAVLRLALGNIPGLIALFWLIWLLRNDHRYNPKGSRRSLLRPFLGRVRALFRFLRAKDLERPVEKRLRRNQAAGLLALGILALAELVNLYALIYDMFFSGVMFYVDGVMLFFQLPLAILGIPLFLALFRAWRSRGLAKDVAALADQVEAVRAGDLEKPLVLPEDGDLRRTADSLNDIQAGMRAALAEQTRSERMKVELVSNVSHDLKTPLTSILSYAELLRQEELPPAAADYARVIDEKAQRLKTMVEDVFEVSRAAADQLPVRLERLDLGKLLRQTLADMDGPIQQSALAFKVELPEEPVMITADGRRLYRVFQNLIDNALRYALEGSRVYLSLKPIEEARRAEVSVRNTSRSELPEGVDFTARFVRGDASRTDGGSGLGLSIASSFTEACGGSFRVETLADLFTAIVSFPTVE